VNEDCASGAFCAMRGETRWCAALCTTDTDCPSGFSCVDAGARLCAPSGAFYGEACTTTADCAAGDCLGGRCTESCAGSATCPTGLLCRRTDDGLGATCRAPAAAAPAEDDGGCNVASRGPGGFGAGGWALVAIALSALLGCRGRRARR
jgi:hypothetical protein